MLTKFWSKAQMKLYISLEKFEEWPVNTFAFCPKCGIDSFELLFTSQSETYIRCLICGSLWIIQSSANCVHCETAAEAV